MIGGPVWGGRQAAGKADSQAFTVGKDCPTAGWVLGKKAGTIKFPVRDRRSGPYLLSILSLLERAFLVKRNMRWACFALALPSPLSWPP